MVGTGLCFRCPFLLEEGFTVVFRECLAGEVVEVPFAPGLADTLMVVGVSGEGPDEAIEIGGEGRRRRRRRRGRGGGRGGGLQVSLGQRAFHALWAGELWGQRGSGGRPGLGRWDCVAWRRLNDRFDGSSQSRELIPVAAEFCSVSGVDPPDKR